MKFASKVSRCFLLLIILCFCSQAFTQNDSADKSALAIEYSTKSFSPADTAMIMSWIRKGTKLQYNSPDSALSYLNKALQHSKDKIFNVGAARALFIMAYTEAGRGDMEKGVEYCQMAYPYCQKAYSLPMLTSDWFVNMGILTVYQGKYTEAAKYFNQGLDEARRLELPENAQQYLSIFNNLSAIYMRMEQPETALKYLNQSEDISRKYSLHRELAFTLCNKANAFIYMRKFDQSYDLFIEGLQITMQHGFGEIQEALNSDMGKLLLEMGKPEEAIEYLERVGLAGSSSSPLYSSIMPGYNLGQAYYQLKDYKKAELQLIATIDKAYDLGFTDGILDAHKTLSSIYESQGNLPKALEQYKKYSMLNSELLSKERAREINELEIKYNSAQKDKELTNRQLLITQQQANINQKNTWILIIILATLLLVAGSALVLISNKNKQNVLTSRINILEKDQQIKLLKASIDGEEQERVRIGRELHDGIGGLLSAVKLQFGSLRLNHQEITKEQDFKKAISLVDEVTVEVRKTAHNLMPEVLVKGGLVVAIRSFCSMISSHDGPDIQVQVYGEIPRLASSAELSIYRIVQELLNNVLKHSNCTEAIVQLNWHNEEFHLSVEDNGRGMSVEKSKGIGLKNMTSRVEAMGGIMEVESTTGVGTCVYLEFNTHRLEPVIKNEAL